MKSTRRQIFNRLHAIWAKRYQRGSLGKSHQNGDYLKTRKSCLPAGIEPAAFGLAAGSIPVERQLFRIACF